MKVSRKGWIRCLTTSKRRVQLLVLFVASHRIKWRKSLLALGFIFVMNALTSAKRSLMKNLKKKPIRICLKCLSQSRSWRRSMSMSLVKMPRRKLCRLRFIIIISELTKCRLQRKMTPNCRKVILRWSGRPVPVRLSLPRHWPKFWTCHLQLPMPPHWPRLVMWGRCWKHLA